MRSALPLPLHLCFESEGEMESIDLGLYFTCKNYAAWLTELQKRLMNGAFKQERDKAVK